MNPKAASSPRPRSGSAPILLNVEDFDDARFLRSRVFRTAGYDVVEAATAGEAFQAAAVNRPSVALIDVNLPDASGITLCDTLKRLHPDLPVLLISAVSLSSDAQTAALAAGASGYLREPVPAEMLIDSVRQAMARPAPSDSNPWLVTDANGVILEASTTGARLLSASPRGLQRRNLLIFFEQEREAWRDAMTRAAVGERVCRSGRVRPKERKPVMVRVEIAKAEPRSSSDLIWVFDTKLAE
jgi:two-component system, NtrC family, response regulator GlrR